MNDLANYWELCSFLFQVGVTRLTISLTVILIEATRSIKFILPLIIVVLCAKWVADACIPVTS